MTALRITERHLTAVDVADETARWRYSGNGAPISDAAAVTIASWWASSGTIGRHLAALATGAPVEPADVERDVTATIQHDKPGRTDLRDLEALAAWAMSKR